MLPPALRPRFVMDSPEPLDTVIARFEAALATPDCPVRGRIHRPHICLSLPEVERRLWTPTLDVDLEPLEHGCRLRGYFGPHPNIWSMYLASFAFLLLVAAAALIIASSQWILDQPATALLALPICLILLLGLYLVALGGQTVCAEQIELIRAFVDEQAQGSR